MFKKCKTEKEVKSLFRKLALRLHPDHGGSADLMALLIDTYDEVLESFKSDPLKDILEESLKRPPTNSYRSYTTPSSGSGGAGFKFTASGGGGSNAYASSNYSVIQILKGDQRLEILDDILEYARGNHIFNSTFALLIKDFLDKKGWISEDQYNRLLEIYHQHNLGDRRGYNRYGC